MLKMLGIKRKDPGEMTRLSLHAFLRRSCRLKGYGATYAWVVRISNLAKERVDYPEISRWRFLRVSFFGGGGSNFNYVIMTT